MEIEELTGAEFTSTQLQCLGLGETTEPGTLEAWDDNQIIGDETWIG